MSPILVSRDGVTSLYRLSDYCLMSYADLTKAVSNKAVAFALIQGTVVTFWNRVLQGTTLAQLHRDWGYGLYVWKAIVSGKHFNILALACVCATLVAVDAPLLQRSVSVHANVPNTEVPLQVSLVPEIPSYATGQTVINDPNTWNPTESYMRTVINDYTARRPLQIVTGCPGTCTAQVQGPALAVTSCTSTLVYVNFSQPLTTEQNAMYNGGYGVPPLSRRIYDIGFNVEAGKEERLVLQTVVAISSGNSTCAGNVNMTKCYLVSAIGEYAVTIERDALQLAGPHGDPKIVKRANNTALTNDTITKNR